VQQCRSSWLYQFGVRCGVSSTSDQKVAQFVRAAPFLAAFYFTYFGDDLIVGRLATDPDGKWGLWLSSKGSKFFNLGHFAGCCQRSFRMVPVTSKDALFLCHFHKDSTGPRVEGVVLTKEAIDGGKLEPIDLDHYLTAWAPTADLKLRDLDETHSSVFASTDYNGKIFILELEKSPLWTMLWDSTHTPSFSCER
jgi:hypothetical protein